MLKHIFGIAGTVLLIIALLIVIIFWFTWGIFMPVAFSIVVVWMLPVLVYWYSVTN